MEKMMSKHRVLLGWIAALIVAVGGWIAYETYKECTMPPTLIFLIPDDYFGPVFVFFDRPDGVDVQPDLLGHAVKVPANGIVKIKAKAEDVTGPGEEGKPAAYYFSVSNDGARRKMKVFVGSYRDTEKDGWYSAYIFENDTLQKFSYSDDEAGEYTYFSDAVKNERMVFARNICDDKFNDLEERPGGPYCGRFFISSPNEQMALPEQVWNDFRRRRDTVQEVIDDADHRVLGEYLVPK